MTQFTAANAQTVVVDRSLALPDTVRLVAGTITMELSAEALNRCADAHDRLATIIREERHVYGITIGFGPLANRLIDKASGTLLQQNLVNHLATGVGPHFGWTEARAIVLARLMSILQGVSGASPEAIRTLVALINSPFAPEIPSKGTVGVSSDLTPLAHMVLCFQGRGDFLLRSGERVASVVALADKHLGVLDLSRRDGLALGKGTSAMIGVGLLNVDAAERALAWAVALTAGLAETISGRIEALHETFGAVRPYLARSRPRRRCAPALRAAPGWCGLCCPNAG